MSEFLDQEKRGGVIASRIEHQDVTAIMLGVELLNKDSKMLNLLIEQDTNENNIDWVIMPEGNDDLEIVHKNRRVYCQIKSGKVTPNELKQIFEKWLREWTNKEKHKVICYFRLHALNGMSDTLSELSDKLNELRNSKHVYLESEFYEIKFKLCETYGLIPYIEIIEYIWIDTTQLLRDSDVSFAYFSKLVREAYPIKNFGDNLLLELYTTLLELFSSARRKRMPIRKKQFLHGFHGIINNKDILIPAELSLITGYELTESGYRENTEAKKISTELQKNTNKIYRSIQRKWIKTYWKAALLPPFFGKWHICKECGHPLMSNLNGLFGLACPDCSYQPYATLYLGCSCGNYHVIKNQPALSQEEFFEAALEYSNTVSSTCKYCGNSLFDEYWRFRLMFLPYPEPMKDAYTIVMSQFSKSELFLKTILFTFIAGAFVYSILR